MDHSRLVMIVAQYGGVISRANLSRHLSRRQIALALSTGALIRVGRGTYALPGLDDARIAAIRLSGVVSHRSAALAHGWPVRSQPARPELIVPSKRKVVPARRRGVDLRWRDLDPTDLVDGWVTGALRTVVDCARDLSLPEALSVADSALRSGAVTVAELHAAGCELPRAGRKQARLVLEAASALPANPFESSLRALVLDAVGPLFEPQPTITLRGGVEVHPDLGCRSLRIALEADSHEFHTSRSQIRRDCWRYDEFTLAGWLPLRFAWDHVMHQEEWVRDVVTRGVELRRAGFAA